jgi:hypothetical protein
MSSTRPSGPVAAYVEGANAQDVDAVVACFAEDAVVSDEGRDRQGLAAIREWATEVIGKYQPLVEVIDLEEASGRTIFTGRVSGNFPGSPVDLRYVFAVRGDKIVRLEIS